MPDILLIQPPVNDFYLTAKRTIPYGLLCIAASLKEAGFSVDIFDSLATSKSGAINLPEELAYLNDYYGCRDVSPFALFHAYKHFGYSFEHIGRIAKASGAFLVGISSLFTPYTDEALKTAETVKACLPDCKVVMGGHHPTAMPESVMLNKAVDFVLRGEGEVSMPALARALKDGGDISRVPGIVFRKNDVAIHDGDIAVMDDLNAYPMPDLSFVKHAYYKRKKGASSVIVASRGCPMTCSYCSIGSSGISYRKRHVESVVKEIETNIKECGVGFIDFEDENLSHDKKWFHQLLDNIIVKFGGKDSLELRAMNGLYPPRLNEDLIIKMKQAGFKTLNLSLGSSSKEQVKRFQRPDVTKALDNILLLAEKYGLDAVCYVIAGAPYQTPESSVSDLLFLAQRRTLAGVSIFYPSPGSPDFELCKNENLLPQHFPMMRSSAIPISHTTTRLESVTIMRLGRVLNYIKSLLDKGESIPEPTPCDPHKIDSAMTRDEKGKLLLSWFLYDAKIRGITPDNNVVDHQISSKLTETFVSGFKKTELAGSKSITH